MNQNNLNGQELKVLRQNHNQFLKLARDILGYLTIIAIFSFLSLMYFETFTSELPQESVVSEVSQ